MIEQTPGRPIDPAELPATITRYLAARRISDAPDALTAFTGDAVVIDDGNTYTGPKAIEKWLTTSATEYTYTVELTAAHRTDVARYVVTHHLEGDFPGGQVDLRYQFTLDGALIESLVIAP